MSYSLIEAIQDLQGRRPGVMMSYQHQGQTFVLVRLEELEALLGSGVSYDLTTPAADPVIQILARMQQRHRITPAMDLPARARQMWER